MLNAEFRFIGPLSRSAYCSLNFQIEPSPPKELPASPTVVLTETRRRGMLLIANDTWRHPEDVWLNPIRRSGLHDAFRSAYPSPLITKTRLMLPRFAMSAPAASLFTSRPW